MAKGEKTGEREAPEEAGSDAPEGTSRRDFLRYAVVGAGGVGIGLVGGGLIARYLTPLEEGGMAEIETYPRVALARLGEVRENQPMDFQYPLRHEHHNNMLIKLGKRAMGGVGPDQDIVAFNYMCTHMGCPLQGQYREEHKILGPCPCHFSTFDLSRRGIVVLGQATETLPQIVLEVEGDTIYATGVSRLIYGFRDNRRDAPSVRGVSP